MGYSMISTFGERSQCNTGHCHGQRELCQLDCAMAVEQKKNCQRNIKAPLEEEKDIK